MSQEDLPTLVLLDQVDKSNEIVLVPEVEPQGKVADNGTGKGMKRKAAFRFNMEADVALLREIIVAEPYAATHGVMAKKWEAIATILGGKYSGETARKRFATLLAEFKSETAKQIKSSGTEEECNERSVLLQDITERIEEEGTKRKLKKVKVNEPDKAALIRDRAMTTLADKPTELVTGASPESKGDKGKQNPLKRGRDDRLLDLMEEEVNIKKRQLDLDQQKAQRDDDKWKVEKAERLAMLELLKQK